jgi:anti-sigma regulatory factor (Ser/Thr protein kinase)
MQVGGGSMLVEPRRARCALHFGLLCFSRLFFGAKSADMTSERSGRTEFYRSSPGVTSFAAEARGDLRRFAQRCELTSADADDLTNAFGELLILTLQPSGRNITPFRFAAFAYPDRFAVEVEARRAPLHMHSATGDADLGVLFPRGFGIAIIRRLATAVTLAENGKRACLIKRRFDSVRR